MSSPPQPSAPQAERRGLIRLVIRIAIIIFSVEALIMLALSGWQVNQAVLQEGLIDASSLTVISSPLIYLWVAMPFAKAARAARNELAIELSAKARQATHLEEALQQSRNLLEQNEVLRCRLQAANQSAADSNERVLQKIGADLHDGPAQLLAYALLRMQKITTQILSDADEKEADEIHRMRAAIANSLKEVRHISTGLSPPGLDTGTSSAMRSRLPSRCMNSIPERRLGQEF